MKSGYSGILPGIPLFWDAAPVRAHELFVFSGCLRVLKGNGVCGGLVYQDWW